MSLISEPRKGRRGAVGRQFLPDIYRFFLTFTGEAGQTPFSASRRRRHLVTWFREQHGRARPAAGTPAEDDTATRLIGGAGLMRCGSSA
jgi:hypothetical protein